MKQKIRAVGFDFDGTLIMSEEKKRAAMASVFREKFGIKTGVIAICKKLSNKGLNRSEKIELIFQHFLKRKPTQKERQEIANDFGKHYEQSLRTCPLFLCTNIIKELKKQVDFLFLLSLEDAREVKTITAHCGLAKYFDEILGGPKRKIENLKHILKKHHLKPQQMVYVGDNTSDIIASKKVKVKVVLIQKKFSYKKLLESLEADFVFSSLCDMPITIDKYS